LPYPGYGRSGARPIRWSRSPESLSEFSVPLLPNTREQCHLLRSANEYPRGKIGGQWFSPTAPPGAVAHAGQPQDFRPLVDRETQCSRAVAMVKAKMLYTTAINRCLLSQRAPSLQEEKRSRTQRCNLGPGWSESTFERNHDLPCCAKS
jgi:hypothetical protein